MITPSSVYIFNFQCRPAKGFRQRATLAALHRSCSLTRAVDGQMMMPSSPDGPGIVVCCTAAACPGRQSTYRTERSSAARCQAGSTHSSSSIFRRRRRTGCRTLQNWMHRLQSARVAQSILSATDVRRLHAPWCGQCARKQQTPPDVGRTLGKSKNQNPEFRIASPPPRLDYAFWILDFAISMAKLQPSVAVTNPGMIPG